jgi:hypothetical protein
MSMTKPANGPDRLATGRLIWHRTTAASKLRHPLAGVVSGANESELLSSLLSHLRISAIEVEPPKVGRRRRNAAQVPAALARLEQGSLAAPFMCFSR